MDTLQSALSLIEPGCFMASIDLKDAYYSVSLDCQCTSEGKNRQIKGNHSSAMLAKSTVVLCSHEHDHRYAKSAAKGKKHSDSTYGKGSASTLRVSQFNGMFYIREQLRNTRFSNETTFILLASWRISTQKHYVSHQNNWFIFASRKQIDPYSPSIVDVLEFLTELFKKGLDYSSIRLQGGLYQH
ncbi:hypothetical protein HOLleu_20631 [Holothuria leucospilota]|uniref:Uncharacterized protein n=1 Tax=Holothuria leucospilota TaxID=206669 RepID=A0A9Q1C1B5_HOLLE|nr:hypothetical protein HOLleu_20631 [Holothuria leucospilota]